MLNNICLFLFALLLAAVQCQSRLNVNQCAARARNFSIELLHYTQLEKDGHVVISPLGIWSLLTGITIGAGGESNKQLRRALLLPRNLRKVILGHRLLTTEVLDPTTADVTLSSKNFMFLDVGVKIKSNFLNSITNNFGCNVDVINFKDQEQAAEDANKIILKTGVTNSDVLYSDDFSDSRMILTNVITFKGRWTKPFNESDTTVEPFYNENKNIIGKVNMMLLKEPVPYSNIKEMKSLVLELPYGKDEKYCMLVMLPYNKIKASEVYQKLSKITFTDIFARLQSDIETFGLEEVNVKLPRFKISSNVVLNKPLNDMGVYDIFDNALANFENMTSDGLYISSIVHKADIEVTESGTVASASTSAHFADRILAPNFHANRPFVYFIMHKPTATVIFSGIYSKPSLF